MTFGAWAVTPPVFLKSRNLIADYFTRENKRDKPVKGVLVQQYEVAILYHPDLEVDLTKAEERVKKILSDGGGKVNKIDNWGKKKLAYPIAKNEHAVYVFYAVDLKPENVQKIEGALNITDEVIRYLIVRIDAKELAKVEAAKAEKAEKAAKREASKKDAENKAPEE